ncbi:MAG TPA: DNA ligase D [Gemmatimonadaceae bacterium]|nr:DNA ligase D [Gemmatimonadaceae bacterium]
MADEKAEHNSPDNLSAYRAKRSADSTPEPMGTGIPATPGRLFVVHKHAARQLHFDLRLEMDGVLRSWAVPRGPSYDTNDKRLAVKVEDHPIEYGDFEGIIPPGNYGAGGVIVWDRGEWIALEDWREGLEKGKLLFEFRGYKLHGKWTLVKIKKSERDWLLIKERDGWVKSPGDQFPEESVLSGLTVEEVKEGKTKAGMLRDALASTEAPRTRVDLRGVQAMLAEPSDQIFTRDGWIFELKLDGYRLLAHKSHGDVLLLTRNGNDYTSVFPEVVRAVKALPLTECIIDGEVVVLDDAGKPSFSRLQKRGRLSSAIEITHAAVEYPATFFAFDLLAFEDFDLRPLPLVQRKALLLGALPKLGPVRPLDHIEREGERFLEQVGLLGLEGVIGKRADSKYRGGRTDAWLKFKTDRTGDFVIVGFTAPKGSRGHFGALQLADMVGGTLAYAGRAGTGFDDKLLEEIGEMLAPIVRETAPCSGPVLKPGDEPQSGEAIPETKTTTWVEPKYVCEVRFREWTPDGLLRHPTFLRLRPDKAPNDCDRQGWDAVPTSPPALRPSTPAVSPSDPSALRPSDPPEKSIAFSNLKKLYWPAEKYTKGDLVEYYRAISPWMLPYLKDRPIVLTRFPDGIDGKSFYQKDAPEFAPEWFRTIPIWSEESQREIRYFVCDGVEGLLYVANMGSIPIHLWASRVGSLELPDWCVIDLDPKEAPFSDVIRTAKVVRKLCDAIEMPSYVKTTGKTGLHILLPLARQCTYAQSRTLGELLARVMLRELGDIATITRHVTKRGDKVYIDYLQNRTGQTIVGPFSVRPLPGATVSMPLTWDEVDEGLDPRAFTIKAALDRMTALGTDPNIAVLTDVPDLQHVLEKLASVLGSPVSNEAP